MILDRELEKLALFDPIIYNGLMHYRKYGGNYEKALVAIIRELHKLNASFQLREIESLELSIKPRLLVGIDKINDFD